MCRSTAYLNNMKGVLRRGGQYLIYTQISNQETFVLVAHVCIVMWRYAIQLHMQDLIKPRNIYRYIYIPSHYSRTSTY